MGFLLLFEMILTSATKGTLVAWGAVNAEIHCGFIRHE